MSVLQFPKLTTRWLVAGTFNPIVTDPGSTFTDYPKLGVWPDGLYMSTNLFDNSNNSNFVGTRLYAFNRTKMESGSVLTANDQQHFDTNDVNDNTFLPSNVRGVVPPTGRENFFLELYGTTITTSLTSSLVGVRKFHVDWTTPANSSIGASTSTIPVATYITAPSRVQELGGADIDTLSDRMMGAKPVP